MYSRRAFNLEPHLCARLQVQVQRRRQQRAMGHMLEGQIMD